MASIFENAKIICRKLMDNHTFSTREITRKETAQLCGLSYQDFSFAEDYLLEKGYVFETLGGPDGVVHLTASGIDFVESEERASPPHQIVINNNNDNVSTSRSDSQAKVTEKKSSSDKNKKDNLNFKQYLGIIVIVLAFLTAILDFITSWNDSNLGKILFHPTVTPTFSSTLSINPAAVTTESNTTTRTPSTSGIFSSTFESQACIITSLNIDPNETIFAGALLTISVKAECEKGAKGINFRIYNSSSKLIGESYVELTDQYLNNSDEISRSWTTAGFLPGQYLIKVEIISAGDDNLSNPASIEKELSIAPRLPIRALVLEIPDYSYSDIFVRLEKIGILFERIPICRTLTHYDLRDYQVIYIPAGWGIQAGCLEEKAAVFKSFISQGGGILVEEANAESNYTTSFLPNNVTFLSPSYQEEDWPPFINEEEHYLINNLDDYELVPGPQDLVAPNEDYTIITSGRVNSYPALLLNEFGEGRVIISTSNPSLSSKFPISDDIWLRMFIWLARHD
jgi:hypothetical protein